VVIWVQFHGLIALNLHISRNFGTHYSTPAGSGGVRYTSLGDIHGVSDLWTWTNVLHLICSYWCCAGIQVLFHTPELKYTWFKYYSESTLCVRFSYMPCSIHFFGAEYTNNMQTLRRLLLHGSAVMNVVCIFWQLTDIFKSTGTTLQWLWHHRLLCGSQAWKSMEGQLFSDNYVELATACNLGLPHIHWLLSLNAEYTLGDCHGIPNTDSGEARQFRVGVGVVVV
jgi:hypothetical protein